MNPSAGPPALTVSRSSSTSSGRTTSSSTADTDRIATDCSIRQSPPRGHPRLRESQRRCVRVGINRKIARERDNTITPRRRFLVPSMRMEHFDLLIVGAGLSGIGAGCHMQERCPDRTFAILEGRDRSGGTWDLFRYPGIRSDSDMYTLGYAFRPWKQPKAIAEGPAILQYLRETAAAHGVDRMIRYEHKVTKAAWSSRDARW